MNKNSCESCPLHGQPRVGAEGDASSCKYVLLGEAPGRDEVRKGLPFVGVSGRLLMKALEQIGVKREQCYITNAVKCKAPNNKVPAAAVSACRPLLLDELRHVPPGVPIIALGQTARNALLPELKNEGVMAGRGWHDWNGRNVFATVHPAYCVYNPSEFPLLSKDLARAIRGRHPPIEAPFEVVHTLQQLRELFLTVRELPEGTRVAIDLETDQVDYQRDRVLCIGLMWEGASRAFIITDEVLYVDAHEMDTSTWSNDVWKRYFSHPRYQNGTFHRPSSPAVAVLNDIFGLEHLSWGGHNYKFDMRFLYHMGVTNVRCDWDTILMHYALDERRMGHALKDLAADYLDVEDYESEVLRYAGKKSGRYSKVPRDILYKYNAKDVAVTLQLARLFEGKLREEGLWERPFLFPLMYVLPSLFAMEINGMKVDLERLKKAEAALKEEEEKQQAVLRELSGMPDLNPRSNPQVQHAVFDVLGIPTVTVRTRSRGQVISGRTTRKEAIDHWFKMAKNGKLDERQAGFVRALKAYRHAQKMRGSYIKNLRRFLMPDGRVHASFLLRGTVTGRLAVKDPPLQTIPSDAEDEEGMLIADSIVAEDGWKLLYADYSQMELRILAAITGDPALLEIYNKPGKVDIHSDIARRFYGPNFTQEQRNWYVKRAVYGWAYGGNVFEIIRDGLVVDEESARWFAEEWSKTFKVANEWRRRQGDLMLKQGYIESRFGRRRRFPLITKDNKVEARLAAGNMPIQSGAADCLLVATERIYEYFRNKGADYVKPVLSVHDSLVLEVREDKVEEVKKVMQEIMESTPAEFFPGVPYIAEVKVGKSMKDFA